MPPASVGPPRGILHRAPAGQTRHARLPPPEDLAPFVEHFWIVAWDLADDGAFVQETLPHPSVHLVLEGPQARIAGVARGRFTRRLEGRGLVLGVKFRPGGFHAFVGWPVSRLTDRVVPAHEVLGTTAAGLAGRVLPLEDDARKVQEAAAFLQGLGPQRDERAETAGRLVARIAADRGLTRVEQLLAGPGDNPRRLQRLFSRYVGVSPKWVVQRYRLHEAVEAIKAGAVVDWAGLALSLGYYDQAHFVRDFRGLVGLTPAAYAAAHAGKPPPASGR